MKSTVAYNDHLHSCARFGWYIDRIMFHNRSTCHVLEHITPWGAFKSPNTVRILSEATIDCLRRILAVWGRLHHWFIHLSAQPDSHLFHYRYHALIPPSVVIHLPANTNRVTARVSLLMRTMSVNSYETLGWHGGELSVIWFIPYANRTQKLGNRSGKSGNHWGIMDKFQRKMKKSVSPTSSINAYVSNHIIVILSYWNEYIRLYCGRNISVVSRIAQRSEQYRFRTKNDDAGFSNLLDTPQLSTSHGPETLSD